MRRQRRLSVCDVNVPLLFPNNPSLKLSPTPSDDVSDCELFDTLCGENLSVKPALVRDQCRHIGKQQTGRPRLFLAVLHNDEAATELLRAARQLRH